MDFALVPGMGWPGWGVEDHVLQGNERRDLWGMWTFKWGSNRGMGYSQEVEMKKKSRKGCERKPQEEENRVYR